MMVRRMMVAGAVLSWLLAGCGQKVAAPPPPPSVNVAEVREADVPLYVATFGNCASVASVTVVPQVTGILAATKFAEGAMVRTGDVLFEIDPRPFQAALEAAQGDLAAAKANLENERQIAARKAKLFETRVIDIQELQTAQASVTAYEGEVLASEAAVETAQINLAYCTITSPIDGKTGRYLINTGNLVTANSSELVSIRTLDPIYVDYTVAETDLPRIQRYLGEGGLAVEVMIPGVAAPAATGKLTFIDNEIAPGSGTLGLRATVPNPDNALVPGLFVNVRLILQMLEGALLVPSPAVLVGADGDFVFVVKPDSTVEQRAVTRGQREGDDVVISAGLAKGEQVVTSGQIALADGAKVTVRTTAVGPSPTPAPVASPSPTPQPAP